MDCFIMNPTCGGALHRYSRITDHVFALMHLLGFRFAPRIRDLSDTKLYLPNSKIKY